MNRFNRALVMIVWNLVFLFAANLHAETVNLLITDWDGTSTNERAVDNGTFITNIVLFRVETRGSLMNQPATGPLEVEVTNQEFERLRKYLSGGVYDKITVHREATILNGQQIKPGEYYFDPARSFRYYFSDRNSKRNYLLESLKSAEKNPNGFWAGKMWGTLQKWSELVKKDPNRYRIYIITARGHTKEHWAEFMSYAKRKGYLPAEISTDHIFNVSLPQFDYYGGINDTSTRKLNLVAEILRNLSFTEPNPGEEHTVIFAENDQNTLAKVRQLFQRRGMDESIKRTNLILVNAGTTSDLRAQVPSAPIIYWDHEFAKFRPVLPDLGDRFHLNLFRLPTALSEIKEVKGVQCKAVFR